MKKYYIRITYVANRTDKGYILDISDKGIGFVSSKPIAENGVINIIPKTDYLIPLKARVVFNHPLKRRSYKYKTGAEFTTLNFKQKAFLKKFIRKLDRRESYRWSFI